VVDGSSMAWWRICSLHIGLLLLGSMSGFRCHV